MKVRYWATIYALKWLRMALIAIFGYVVASVNPVIAESAGGRVNSVKTHDNREWAKTGREELLGGIALGRWVDAIRRAEGNPNYGVINGNCLVDEPGHCRYMCKEIVRVHHGRWDGRGRFLDYLASKYAPVSAHPLNRNWKRNVSFYLTKGVTQ